MSTKIEVLIGQHVDHIDAPSMYIIDEEGRVGLVTKVRDGGRVLFA